MDSLGYAFSIQSDVINTLCPSGARASETDYSAPPPGLLNRFLGGCLDSFLIGCGSKSTLNASKGLMGLGIALFLGDFFSTGLISGAGLIVGGSIFLGGLILGGVYLTASTILSEDPPSVHLLKTFKSAFESEPLKEIGLYLAALGVEAFLAECIAAAAITSFAFTVGLPFIIAGVIIYFGAWLYSQTAESAATIHTPLLQNRDTRIN